MLESVSIWVTLNLIVCHSCSQAQQFPENACSQYFQYGGGGTWYGELTIPHIVLGQNRLDLRFSQQGVQSQAVVGSVLPFPDEASLRDSAHTHRAGKFRLVLWPNGAGFLPKLTKLIFNGAELCSASEYGPPNSYFNRFYGIFIGGGPRIPFNQAPLSPVEDDIIFNFPALIPSSSPPSPRISTFFTQILDTTTPTYISRIPMINWLEKSSRPPSTTSFPATPPSVSVQTALIDPVDAVVRIAPSQDCGREGNLSPLIYRGETFARGQYPWLTAVYHKERLSHSFQCGGSLVTTLKVITAAHCVYMKREDRVFVMMGRYDLDKYNEEGAEARELLRILTHPQYSTRSLPDADIAILTLALPVEFNDIIRPICLWEESTETTDVLEVGWIAGWGTDENDNPLTRFPHVVEAPIVSDADCQRNWRAKSQNTNRTLCAGNLNGAGPCFGDSGGGLMVKRDDSWLLRGIVSLAERSPAGKCNLTQYVLFCDLSKHMEWIHKNLN